jgi:hypothetical protein
MHLRIFIITCIYIYCISRPDTTLQNIVYKVVPGLFRGRYFSAVNLSIFYSIIWHVNTMQYVIYNKNSETSWAYINLSPFCSWSGVWYLGDRVLRCSTTDDEKRSETHPMLRLQDTNQRLGRITLHRSVRFNCPRFAIL